MNVGEIVVKVNGRFAGRASIITSVKEIDKGYVEIAIPYAKGKVKMKRSNIKHILPLNKRLEITGNEDNKKLWEVIEKENLEDLFIKRINIG